jgi:hypothetical protein
MGIETVLMIASAASSVAGGAAQKRQYNAQAAQAQIQGRSQAIAYRQQGADVLRNLNETLAATIAMAGAGNVDPTSGSARVLQEYARAEASSEFGTALDNAVLATAGAQAQAGIYRQAGQAAFIGGIGQAAGTIGVGIGRALDLNPTFSTSSPQAYNPASQGGMFRSR